MMIAKNTAFQSTTVIEPQNTWVWSVIQEPEFILVQCQFGQGGVANNNAISAPIERGVNLTVPFSRSAPDIAVSGQVTATWLSDGGFIVTFNGYMVNGYVSNTFSTGGNNMIVCVYASTT